MDSRAGLDRRATEIRWPRGPHGSRPRAGRMAGSIETARPARSITGRSSARPLRGMSVSWFAGPRINTELLDHEPPKQRNRINHRPVDGIVVARRREVLDAHEAHG